MTDNNERATHSLRFEQVLAEELEYMRPALALPPKGKNSATCSDENAGTIIRTAHRAHLTGLAFSGGGIRSATFNLGVLQALAKLGILKHVDYLSTVSGGGYIGSWFSAWVRRENDSSTPGSNDKSGLERVTCALKESISLGDPATDSSDTTVRTSSLRPDPPPIWHLREYSSYLSPVRGLFSADTLTLGVTYIRNFLLTFSLLLLSLVAVVLFVRVATSFYYNLFLMVSIQPSEFSQTIITALFTICISLGSFLSGYELSGVPVKSRHLGSLSYPAIIAAWLTAYSGSLWVWGFWQILDNPETQVHIQWILLLIIFPVVFYTAGRYFTPHPKRMVLVLFLTVTLIPPVLFMAPQHTTLFDPITHPGSSYQQTEFVTTFVVSILVLLFSLWILKRERQLPALLVNLANALVSALVLLLLVMELREWISGRMFDEGQYLWTIVIWTPVLFILIFSLVALVFVGISGNSLHGQEREWLGRFFAVLGKWILISTLMMILIAYSTTWLDSLYANYSGPGLTALWGAISGAGAFLSRNILMVKEPARARIKVILVSVAPYVFIVGMLVAATWLTEKGMLYFYDHFKQDQTVDFIYILDTPFPIKESMLFILITLFTLIASMRMGVNRFSLHSMYANRLIRAYLGASNLHRKADPFTGFCKSDNDLKMSDLVDNRESGDSQSRQDTNNPKPPLQIINASINLVSSDRLAWQKRKAASFVFTPLHSGYEFCDDNSDLKSGSNADLVRSGGYVSSADYTASPFNPGGISVGKAMAISGAAASPNMGFHSSPAITFLMTVFNVRLGWWLPNTSQTLASKSKFLNFLTSDFYSHDLKNRISQDSPKVGLIYLLKELFGSTDETSEFVYLSDGGHFENLGIYELVKRRCHTIIACDAEEDYNFEFDGLGNAIEKCGIDFGIPIDIDVSSLACDPETGYSQRHCAIGIIRYSEADPGQHDGVLIYIKATRGADEPVSVATYAKSNPRFPHQSTADQWFDESQFESYRALGEHIGMKVFDQASSIAESRESDESDKLERLVLELRKLWQNSDPVQSGQDNPDHDVLLETILDTLRTDPNLWFMDGQFYPNLPDAANKHLSESKKLDLHLPQNYRQFRAGFYFCKRLLQFMQDVYYQRHFDQQHNAPSNRGWMNLFRRWSWSCMLRFTWSMTSGAYSARFQSFCEYRLGLDFGKPVFGPCLNIHVDLSADKNIQLKFHDGRSDHRDLDWQRVMTGRKRLHHHETRLIEEFIHAYCKHLNDELNEDQNKSGNRIIYTAKNGVGFTWDHFAKHFPEEIYQFQVYPIALKTNDPLTGYDDETTELNAGFMIVGLARFEKENAADTAQKTIEYKKAILYFRIRPSMRNMGIARRTFRSLSAVEELRHLEVKLIKALQIDKHKQSYWTNPNMLNLDDGNIQCCEWYANIRKTRAVDAPVDATE